MKRFTKKQQKIAAAAEDTAAWVAQVRLIRQYIPAALWALWPAVVSHNNLLITGGDFAAAHEHRENWLRATAYVDELEVTAATLQEAQR